MLEGLFREYLSSPAALGKQHLDQATTFQWLGQQQQHPNVADVESAASFKCRGKVGGRGVQLCVWLISTHNVFNITCKPKWLYFKMRYLARNGWFSCKEQMNCYLRWAQGGLKQIENMNKRALLLKLLFSAGYKRQWSCWQETWDMQSISA